MSCKDLRLRLDKIAADKAQFNLADRLDINGHVQLREREMTHSYVKSSDIIGREGDREAIVKFLMDSRHGRAGDDDIDELLSRGFFQDSREDMSFGWTFKMHDLVRDLACSLGQEEFTNITGSDKSISERVRHLYFKRHEIPADSRNANRSLILSSEEAANGKNVLLNILSKFKYLRFLSVRSCNELPDTIGTLKHLRHLDLSLCYDLTRLPDSICKLHNLETLNLRNCFLEELPKNIGELINLRYLWLKTIQTDLPHNNRIECLPSLQFFMCINCDRLRTLFDKTENLSLRTLIVSNCENLVSLFSMSISTARKYSLTTLEVLYIYGCPNLSLNYKVGKDREGDEEKDYRDEDEDSQYLHLPRLRSMALLYLPHLKRLPEWIHGCAATLQYLEIYECENLEALPEWLPNLTSLHTLKIEHCSELLSLPQGMERLAALKQLKIVNCGELGRRCEKETGEDWHKIAHVPNITVY